LVQAWSSMGMHRDVARYPPNPALRQARLRAGWSQDEFAERLGTFMRTKQKCNVSPSGNLVGMWERGEALRANTQPGPSTTTAGAISGTCSTAWKSSTHQGWLMRCTGLLVSRHRSSHRQAVMYWPSSPARAAHSPCGRTNSPKMPRVPDYSLCHLCRIRRLIGAAECCIGSNKACISAQVTIRSPRRRQPHRAARPATI
jgi:transcriptional regulator with XRE-family HTH domain